MFFYRFKVCCLLSCLSTYVLLSGCYSHQKQADVILTHGNFYTVDSNNSVVDAIAITDGRILAIGDSSLVFHFKGNRTQIIDVKGRFGCPGFNDAHIHLRQGVRSDHEVDFSGVTSTRDIQRLVLKTVRKLTPGAWLVGWGWDQTQMTDGRWPNRKILDAVAPSVPMFIMRTCGHVALVNQKALNIAGIHDGTPNPVGGEIERDARGKATGILKEEAIQLVRQYIPVEETDDLKNNLSSLFKQLCEYGITSIQDLSDPQAVNIYEELLQQDHLPCHIYEWLPLRDDLEQAKAIRHNKKSSPIRYGLLKGYIDGSLGPHTAALYEPYQNDPQNRGLLTQDPGALKRQVVQADAAGFQLGIHAIGDLANHLVLDAYELAIKVNNNRDRRHRIEHAQVLIPEDLNRFKKLNVVASMQPVKCVMDLKWVEKSIGRQRSQYAYAWRSLLESGAVLAFGSDWPFAPLNPFVGLYAAVTRRDTTGYPPRGWIPKERLSIEDAIRAYTLGSAYAEFQDRQKGSLEIGKHADIIILDHNLLTASPEEILKTQVIATFFNGSLVYQNNF